MANGDEQAERVDPGERGVRIKRGSWLRNVSLDELPDGTISWTIYEAPEIPEREGDLTITISEDRRPEEIANDFYGTPEAWWIVAEANGARLPLVEFASGVELRIPDPDWVRDQLEGEGVIGR